MADHADLLNIAGIEHSLFNTVEDVTLTDEKDEPVARVFRRNGKVVYRAGRAVMWDDTDGRPHDPVH